MKKILLSLLVLLCATPALAEDYGGIPAKFFAYLAKDQTGEAIDYLYGTNRWVQKNSDQVTNLKGELAKLNSLVGKYLFHELLVEQKVGTRYAHLVYLVGYERQPLRFEIKVYKNSGQWSFYGVSFDDRLTDDIEKMANDRIVP